MRIDNENVIYAGIYPGFSLNFEDKIAPCGIDFYKSEDNGLSWNIQGRIPYEPDLNNDPNGNKRNVFGFTEPAFEILKDGSFICIMRSADKLGNSGMYISKSHDKGISWTDPKVFTTSGVLPKLLKLKNGILILASGRPGVQVRFSIDGKGEEWTDPFEMLPFTKNEAEKPLDINTASSCGYTDILAIGKNEFLIIYSDFKYRDKSGEIRKLSKLGVLKFKR